MFKAKIRGQSLTEVALCLAVATAVFISMQLYVKRGLQAKYRAGADFALKDIPGPKQYEPYYYEADTTDSRQLTENKVYGGDGKVNMNSQVSRSGWQRMNPRLPGDN